LAERVYCSRIEESGRVRLDRDEAHHLIRVRRVEPGSLVEIFDGLSDSARLARVVSIERDDVEVELAGPAIPGRSPPVALSLITAVPKGDRFDWLVEKAVEVGVTRLLPMISRRSVVEPRTTKIDRLRRRVIEASKQCGRNRLMELAPPAPWPDLADSTPATVRLLADPQGLPFHDWPEAEQAATFALAVGPEGGFAAEELELARGAGWIAVRLGTSVMRVETAGIVGASLVLARYGGDGS
jgi:16S rRNA (uracil1498-N3)-methyltransferase